MMNLKSIKSIIGVTILTAAIPVLAQSRFETKPSTGSQKGYSLKGLPIMITRDVKAERLLKTRGNLKNESMQSQDIEGAVKKRLLQIPQSDEMNKLKPQSLGGTGVDGGGADINPAHIKELTPEMLANYLNNQAPKTLEHMFNTLESDGGKYSYYVTASNHQTIGFLTSIYQKLFSSASTKNIFTALSSATIKLQAEPCFDPVSKLYKDASAIASKNLICVSYERIKNKTNPIDLDSTLIPLLAHEYSHLVNATEDEAEALETFLVKMRGFDLENASNKIDQFENNANEAGLKIYSLAVQLQDLAKNGNTNQICKKALDLNVANQDLKDAFISVYDFSPLAKDQVYHLEALKIRIENLALFCEYTGLKSELDDLEEFGTLNVIREALWKKNEKELSLYTAVARKAQYFDEQYGDISQYLRPLQSEKLERVHPNNRRALQTELIKIQRAMIQVGAHSNLFPYLSNLE